MKRLTLRGGVNVGIRAAAGAIALLAGLTWTRGAGADVNVVNQPATPVPAPAPMAPAPTESMPPMAPVETTPPPAVMEKTTTRPPNVGLVSGGLIAFGGSYIPSIIVAAANNNSWDNHLYIPVVGPWLDLGNRPPCGGPFQTSCSTEGGFKALLIVDGAFQGLGALATIIGLVTPETRTVVTAHANADHKKITAALKPENVHFVPAALGRDAYGVAAFGNF